jgi:serine/threonine protein phosphatase 1
MSRFLSLPENTQGRDFVIGDLHGAEELLKRAMAEAKFDPAKDRVISCGDLVDRGPNSADALWLLQQPWFFAARGNHENAFLRLCDAAGKINKAGVEFNRKNGMGWIAEQTPETLKALYAAISNMPYAIDVKTDRGTVGFLHAEVPTGLDWDTFRKNLTAGDSDTVKSCLWSRARIEANDASGVPGIDRVFSGHTTVGGGAKQLGNCFYVDTGAVFRLLKINTDPEMFFTFANIRAEPADLKGPAAKDRLEKVTVKAPPKGTKFAA